MFETLLSHWQAAPAAAEAPADSVESWPAFRDRVRRGLERITDRPGRGRRVAAFTSGGFIGTAVGLVLGVPDRTCLELNWRLKNGVADPPAILPRPPDARRLQYPAASVQPGGLDLPLIGFV